ncbi:Brp/Blh family beta-carotene 15,15'-dioxygenase [Natronoarchaeum philippinense]|uniref:Brp/Blh family beta-carotene 15,15'-dioxygenase n=1 Tax=Natronoarchaeum philippinense TaxID=558529 RepID=UPI001FE3537F|nr:Brp/Blh family beta-carotene 15,15'-dioxygenase [Natronoarchaeum philippinense]
MTEAGCRRPTLADDAVRRSLVRTVVVPSWVAVALVLGADIVAPLGSLSLALQLVPLAASLVVLGVPHGAVDHLALPRAAGRRPGWRSLARVGGLYLLVGSAYAAVWVVTPIFAAVSFLVLTWVHWGQGDLYSLVALVDAEHLRSRRQRALAVTVRGGVPMVVPLLAFPGWYRRVVAAMAAPFGAVEIPAWPFSPAFRSALGIALAVVTIAALADGYRRTGATTGWRIDAGETALLWAYFWTVPPLLSIGVYFCLWHSLRHVGRLAALDPAGAAALSSGASVRALGRVGRDAAPLTVVSLAVLAASYVVVAPGSEPLSSLGLYLAFIAALTLPHTIVVFALDRRQGLWNPTSVGGGGASPTYEVGDS